ncbi:bis(5'-nucleosyl)-tetraphosphatase PrpE [Aquibacillus albus]|uniref:Diadenosine tetraphosphatase ApaH/serine/threonine PP2A family protein phosphatase n=1 Tax=Aquibacillus albus TaxID=1168171 RepID=A0ABS2N0H7_9BACI|nr:bis(5'-nucleosyl)-tetraphosphatase PrpE [Aquibacillus albus]MBM7571548.1 diadenosine tetraphosphatase ApaH/serine/threonine PP2A family protein phosphatase [Aquibacillus albus]
MKVDIIGDIHGCFEELVELFHKLDYQWKDGIPVHPENRIPVFLGDLTDRGPDSIKTIDLVYRLVMEKKLAKYVPGNHCNKLYRYFLGNNVKQQHGLETTVAEFKKQNDTDQSRIRDHFIKLYEHADLYLQLPPVHAIVAHAGIREDLIGRNDKKVKTFVLYGDITGEKHPDGRPIRRDWAQSYHGEDWIVYGHTPVRQPRIVNKTINIDTGCVFGNALTAFQLPEEKIISVPSKQPFVEEKFNSFD